MDVVRSNIEKLNGLIELDSAKNEGTTITIKLPLTLAIIQGLMVQCEEEVFILPLSSVIETVKTEHSDIHYVNKRPVLLPARRNHPDHQSFPGPSPRSRPVSS